MRKSYHQLDLSDRKCMEKLFRAGKSKKEIAQIQGVHVSTVYRELKRGACAQLDTYLRTYTTYSYVVAQDRCDKLAANKGAPLKIEGNSDLVDFLEDRIMQHRDSPAAVSARLRASELPYLSEATIYRYAHRKLLPRLRKWHLPEKGIRKHPYKPVIREVKQPRYGTSIEKRPAAIAERNSFGHWEMDCVIGSSSGTDQACLVFTERLTRLELIFKLHTKDSSSVVAVLDRLQHSCNFRRIFKSITCDNGSEFANARRIEFSAKGRRRTRCYYCHPYTSCERGSNENANRLIRRWFKKGKSLKHVTAAQTTQVAVWMNTYPREILGWKTPSEAFQEACAAEGIKISKNFSLYLS